MSHRGAPVRGARERIADVTRWLDAARAVHAERARWIPLLVQSTGLTPEGVELGFASLEREATQAELSALLACAGEAPSVHVILSANVFVAPLRAIALARAASASVTVRASPRDPVLARALVDAAGDDALSLVGERDVAAVDAAEIHVYGRDASIAEVRARVRPGTLVRGYGAGMGVAWISALAEVGAAAEALARDVVPFDQRGCASPRVVFVEDAADGAPRTRAVALQLHDRLAAWGARVPRGALSPAERADAARWRDALAFAGDVWTGADHDVAVARTGDLLAVPPSGRHVLVVPVASPEALARCLAPIARFVVAVGSDDPASAASVAPRHARVVALGAMQHPALDGPLDRRDL